MRKFLYFFIPNILLLSCSKVFMTETKAVVLLSLTVSQGTSTQGVVLDWSSQWDFATFNIYRGDNDSDLVLFSSNIVQTSWLDEETIPGKSYFYQVVAYNGSGRIIGQSQVLSGVRAYISFDKVKAPEDLRASIDKYSDRIELYWVGGAQDRFRIYRSDVSKGTYQQITETGGIFYTDKSTQPGSTYYYKITAVGVDNDGKVKEREMIGQPQEGRTLNAPQGLSASKNNRNFVGAIALSWDEDKTVEYYKVYRSASQDGSYSLVAPFVVGNNYIDWALPNLKGSYEGSDFKYPSYFYKIVAVKNAQDSGASTAAEGSAINPDDLFPAPQVNVEIDKSSYPYNITISWSAVKSGNVTYILSKKESTGNTPMVPVSTASTMYTLPNEPLGTRVEYVVQAVNPDAGNLAGEEGTAVYQSLTPAPPVIKTITTNARKYMTNKVESTNIQTYVYWSSKESMVGVVEKWWKITSTVGNIDLTWEKKDNSEPIDSYNIYRKGPNETQYVKINRNPVTALHYSDIDFNENQYSGSAVNGNFEYPMYSYKIAAVANGNESMLSEVAQEASAINPKDLLPAPEHLGIPHHWASGTGWGNTTIVKGNNTTTGDRNIDKYAYGIDQIPLNAGGRNFLWLVWKNVSGASDYQVRHSRGELLEDWYTHSVVQDTKLWLNNETTASSMTGLYLFSDFWGYSRENAAFEVASVNQNAGGLLGDTIGIWFNEPANKPNGY